jgi:hypothetical protein
MSLNRSWVGNLRRIVDILPESSKEWQTFSGVIKHLRPQA